MRTTRGPVTISVRELSKTVQQAVAKHNIPAHPGFHCGPIIMGIILRPEIQQLEQANQIASNVTAHFHGAHEALLAGSQLQPAVLSRPGGPIICGFIAENLILQE